MLPLCRLLLIRRRQYLFIRIDHEDRKELRRLGRAGVLADFMMCTRLFEPALAGAIDLGGFVIDLAADRTRQNVSGDEGGFCMMVRR